jgi:hypothetical protein
MSRSSVPKILVRGWRIPDGSGVRQDRRRSEAVMLPTWMIEEIEKSRREREVQDRRPTLHVELPEEPLRPQRRPEPRETVIVIDFG